MELTISEQIRILAARRGLALADLAQTTGQSRQNFSNKLKRDNWTVRELNEIAAAAGVRLSVQFIDDNGKEV